MRSITTKISSQGQLFVPKELRGTLNLEKGAEVILVPKKEENGFFVKKKPKSWVDYSKGLGKEIWRGIDVDKWLRKERESWDK